MPAAVLILGSNSGNKRKILEKSKILLSSQVGEITQESSLYETEPWGFDSEEQFINQVIVLDTFLSPEELLKACQSIENTLGRERISGVRYSSRTIDIDILFYNSDCINSPTLTIPHPRIEERNFVLTPLNEIMPDFIHPTLKKSIYRLFSEKSDLSGVKKLP